MNIFSFSFLDSLSSHMQRVWYSHTFIAEQAIEDFEDARDGGGQNTGKKIIEFKEVTVHSSDTRFFLICSDNYVFILNDGNDYARLMTAEEVDALDFIIVWNGPTPIVEFEANDKKAVETITRIITNINLLQPERFYGFPLASIISHLRAFLYPHILESHKSFYTTIVVSGEQRGTGDLLLLMLRLIWTVTISLNFRGSVWGGAKK